MSWAIRLGNTGIIPPLIPGTAHGSECKICRKYVQRRFIRFGREDAISDCLAAIIASEAFVKFP